MHTICLQWSAQIDDQGLKKQKKNRDGMRPDEQIFLHRQAAAVSQFRPAVGSGVWQRADFVVDKRRGRGEKKNASGMHGVKKKKKERKKSET